MVVAKTDIDFVAIGKGAITASDVANHILQTMNEYANNGFYFIDEKLKNNPSYFCSVEIRPENSRNG